MDDDNNIVQFGSIVGGKEDKKDFPAHPYVLTDVDGEEYYYDGFLIFTTHHVAVMVEGDDGEPVAGIMMPLHRLKSAEIADVEDETIN